MRILFTCSFMLLLTCGIFSQPMNGSYTVGGAGADFDSLQLAANAVMQRGVSGPVTFNIRPGIYEHAGSPGMLVVIDQPVAGMSVTNRIIFQPDAAAGGNVNNVILQINCNANTYYRDLMFIKVHDVTVRNLTFKDADSMDTPANSLFRVDPIPPDPGVDDIEITGCRFTGSPYTSQGYVTDYGIFCSNIHTVSVSNNHFNYLMETISLNATSGIVGDSAVVEDNSFNNLYRGYTGSGNPLGQAIAAQFDNVNIRRNFVSNSGGASGILVINPLTAVIEENYVQGNFLHEFYSQPAYTDRTSLITFKNNIADGTGDGSGSMTILTKNTRLFNNTIINYSGFGEEGLYVTGDSCSIVNDILLSYGGTICYDQSNTATHLISDHNVFYSTDTYFSRSGGNLYLSLTDYQQGTGLDINSKFSDISFITDSLGIHFDECSAQNPALIGIPLSEVPLDFYGTVRDSVRPFVGAVEGGRLPFDMFGAPYKSALSGFALSVSSGAYDNTASLEGLAVPDYDNNKILLFHNNGARTFTRNGTIFTDFKPVVAKLFDFDSDNNLDLIVGGDTNAVEIFWGDGTGQFSNPDIVETAGRVRSLKGGPRFQDFSTIITTEDNGFVTSTSYIGYIMVTAGRQLCYDQQYEGNDIDTIPAVLTDFILADLGAGRNMPAIVAPGIYGTSNVISKFFAFDVMGIFGGTCSNTNTFFSSADHEYLFPTTGYYTNSSSIIAGDFDNDGDTDLVTDGFSQNNCIFIKNQGNFTFTYDTIATNATRGLAALDYENDGDLDFVTINNTLDSAGISVFLNDGQGVFTQKNNCFFPFAHGHPYGITAADYDLDGKTDIAVVARSAGGEDSLFVLYNLGGFNSITGIKSQSTKNYLPEKFSLSQNYPNPFNPSTNINFNLPSESNVKLFIYNILGEKVKELVNGIVSAGQHTVNFNSGGLASGIYIYQIDVKSVTDNTLFRTAKKMVLLR